MSGDFTHSFQFVYKEVNEEKQVYPYKRFSNNLQSIKKSFLTWLNMMDIKEWKVW